MQLYNYAITSMLNAKYQLLNAKYQLLFNAYYLPSTHLWCAKVIGKNVLLRNIIINTWRKNPPNGDRTGIS